MELSHLFDVSPFLALSFCVCLGTVTWCAILLHRGCHHIADRFLLGFIGLLAVYQSVQILRRGGVLVIPHLKHVDEAVDLLVNAMYLLAAVILRISNHDRFETIFRLRLAEAQPAQYVHDARREGRDCDSVIVDMLRAAAPMLSANALRLYLYACLRLDRPAGVVEASEDELLQSVSNDRKALMAAFKELREKGLCELETHQTKRVRITPAPKIASSRPEQASAAG